MRQEEIGVIYLPNLKFAAFRIWRSAGLISLLAEL
jgi:hypothetical protein